MKRLITTLIVVLLFGLTGYAQKNAHITFRDVPIDGNINAFVKKLEAKGYTQEKTFDNGVRMSGSFLNKTCEVWVYCTPVSRTTTKVIVYMPKDNSWSSLKSTYLTLKEQYTKKYGTPSDEFEFFSTPYYEGDGYETQALELEKCTYSTYWQVPYGVIGVSISEFLQIRLVYEDAHNIKIMEKESMQAAYDEI